MQATEAAKLLKEFRYDNANDTIMRLKGTIVRYRGQAVYVTHCQNDSLNILIEDISHGRNPEETISVHTSDVDLDISSAPLGWSNFNDYSLYLMRSAKNSQKQGVNPGSLIYFDPDARLDRQTNRFSFQNHDDLYSIGNTIMGNFPSIKYVLNRKKGGAIHADWALLNLSPERQGTYYTLFHKTTPVAAFNKKTGRFLFRRLRLTKTRKASLQEVLNSPDNVKEGAYFVIAEQK